jgi:hypothetical protein
MGSIAREDIVTPGGRRLIVQCTMVGCNHAVLMDQRKVFGSAKDWPREGHSTRFRCQCGSRQTKLRYTRNEALSDGPISNSIINLWV